MPLSTPADFSAFYERTHLSLFRYLYGLTGGPQEEVEDLTAEAFTRAWRARRRFEGNDAAALAWLMKIGRSLVYDAYRRRKVRPVMDDALTEEVPALGSPPEEIVQTGEEQQQLLSMLQRLPAETREILVLRYLLGWPVNQIAQYVETSENNVSAIIHRSLERLRRQWPDQEA
jgi:RNA polymerase sigma-70 factor (ECF subfamily)